MPLDFVPGNDAELNSWMQNFVGVLGEYSQSLGIPAADVAACRADLTNLNATLSEHLAQQNVARAATVVKDAARADAVANIRLMAKRLQVAPGITDSLRSRLGISVPKTRVRRRLPVVPAGLVVRIRADGGILLRWDANGNQPGVVYLVESKTLGADGWGTAGVTTRVRFSPADDAPGKAVFFRVRAMRGEVLSGPSGEAVIGLK